ncbi:serine hydrolase domain-containing protein [Tenacibaculum singaporense]|uniref:serine hydrolase domain-containing protein n=1 Tax=Tenacibaculum singaporense TaxID=2358479 RepID=UPI000F65BD41|nr:serine hydrolase [Tenacibaculum singaporense]RSC93063.1 class C beta-lactamase-related serine hydrolase [Tenacibaculum singaporense]
MKFIKLLMIPILGFSIFSFSNYNKESNTPILFFKNDFKNKSEKQVHTEDFTLYKDEYLSLQFELEKPLIQYLKELAPDLTEEQLLNKGNFQFSFLVDNKLIYTENLNKGAGTPSSKTTQLKHTIPLIYPERLDYWGWFMWLKFMKMNGGRDALYKGNHLLTIEVKPYVNSSSLKVGKIIAKGDLNMKIRELPYDKNLVPIQKISPANGWEISKEVYKKEKIEALNKKIAQGRFEHINGIVVVKDNKLLIEEYFNGSSRESLHDPRSVGKTIASTITGIAIKEGYIKDESVKLKEFYDLKTYKNYSLKKDSVTLKSLLTMSSGFVGDDDDYSNPGNEEFMYPTSDWVKFALDLPMSTDIEVGEKYSYFTAGVVVLGDILNKTVPNGLVTYADDKLFSPLGITNYKWEYTPQNVGNTAGGIRLRAIDFAKYGQLYKNEGHWNNQQIISKRWVEKSLSKQIKQPYTNDSFYGYLFWNKTYRVNNKNYEVSFCSGNGGNKIFIFKDIPFVVVITASGYGLPYMHSDVDKIITDYILPAVI